jgi:hypothetical protein
MHIGKPTRVLLSLFLVAILVMSPVASAASAGMGASAPIQQSVTQQSFDTGEEIQITDDVAVWDRSMLPLRANLSEADLLLQNHNVEINDPDNQQRSANRLQLGVFEPGDIEVALSNDVDGADTTQSVLPKQRNQLN